MNRHRPGKFSQSNKKFKGFSKSASKRKGKQDLKRGSIKIESKIKSSKSSRKNRQIQKRKVKKKEALLKQRIGGRTGPPKIVGILSLSDTDYTEEIKCGILFNEGDLKSNGAMIQTTVFEKDKKRLTFVKLSSGNKRSVLDGGKVADLLVLVVSVEEGVNEQSQENIRLLNAQGFPKTILVVRKEKMGKKKVSKRVKRDEKNFVLGLKTFLPSDCKMVNYEKENLNDVKKLKRMILEISVNPIHWRDQRSYMLVDGLNFKAYKNTGEGMGFTQNEYQKSLEEMGIKSGTENGEKVDMEFGDLEVRGFLRGKPINPNMLVHIVNYGTFQVKKIEISADPHPVGVRRESGEMMDADDVKYNVTEYFPDGEQEALDSENTPDPFLGEPSEMNFENDDKFFKRENIRWIRENDEDTEFNLEMKDEENDFKMGEEEIVIEEKKMGEDDEGMKIDDEQIRMSEIATTIDKEFNIEMDDNLTEEEKEAEKEYFTEIVKKYKKDNLYRDFVQTPEDTLAKVRFQKYRGVESLRKCEWDPYLQLPFDYGKIFQLQNYNRSKRNALKIKDNFVDAEIYVKITLKNVPTKITTSFDPLKELMICFELLKHEQRTSVSHFLVKKFKQFEQPIKSKDEMYVQVGFRTYKCRPIFSENNLTTDKYKFQRFLHNEFSVGTIFSHITYTPAPVLVFVRSKEDGKTVLAASGHLIKVDPCRIILKKIVLTGHIYRSNKRKSVVRYMFHNPVDVKYYKKLEVYTTNGKRGIIRESVGKHGRMKVLFQDNVQQNQLCCMNLYKRVFPKWNTSTISFL